MKKTEVKPLSFGTILLFWPLLFVPIILYLVKTYGSIAGTVALGALFFYLAAFKADARTRRLMIVLAVISAIFETANVAAGLYAYPGVLGSPAWIPLGWAVFGWWAVSLTPVLCRISTKAAFITLGLALVAAPYFNGTLSISSVIALAGIYVITLASTQPAGIYVFSALFAMLAEYSGTATKVWSYFNPSGLTHAVVPPDLASLALSYSVVLAVCFWISGFEGPAQQEARKTRLM